MSEPVQAETGPAPRRVSDGRLPLRFETIGSIAAIVVGVAALFVSWDQGRVMRQEIRASLWPVLQVDGFVDAESGQVAVGVQLENAGVGPAIVKRVSIWHRGVLLEDLDAVSAILEGSQDLSQQTLTGRVIAAGATATPFVFRFPSEGGIDAVAVMNEMADEWRIEVCYCSALDQCWLSDPQSSPSMPIDRCDGAPASDL